MRHKSLAARTQMHTECSGASKHSTGPHPTPRTPQTSDMHLRSRRIHSCRFLTPPPPFHRATSPLSRFKMTVSAMSSALWPVASLWALRREAPRSRAWEAHTYARTHAYTTASTKKRTHKRTQVCKYTRTRAHYTRAHGRRYARTHTHIMHTRESEEYNQILKGCQT